MSKTPVTVTDPAVDAAAMQKMIVARIAMLMHQPFFGNIATRLIIKNADEWCETAATDGRHLYYNSEFVNKLREKEVIFLVAHEVLHNVYDTFGRRNGRDNRLWNIASDYTINRDLVDYRVGEMITTIKVLYDKKYNEMTSEEIYEELLKNAKQIDIDALAKQLLDDHLDGDEDGKPQMSPEERQQAMDEMKEAILSAAQAVGAGNVPSGIRRLIDGLTEPKMNWREILQQQIESQIKNDFTFMRPSRRGWSCDAILPSMKREPSVECHIALDTSGSIGADDLRAFLTEVKGIMDQHASFKIGILSFDTQVYNYKEFTEDNCEELLSYEPAGGGGTMFECIWEYYKQEDIVPKQLVVMTDMYPCGRWCPEGDEEYAGSTVFLAYHSDIVAPFGITVKYD